MMFRKLVLVLLLFVCIGWAQQPWQPQKYVVEENKVENKLTLSTPYYTFVHNLKQGGALERISLNHGVEKNLLLTPISANLGLKREKEDPPASWYDGGVKKYSTANDTLPEYRLEEVKGWPVLTILSNFRNSNFQSVGVRLKTKYTYKWGYVKIHHEVIFPELPKKVSYLEIMSTKLAPSLDHYGYIPGVSEATSMDNLFGWEGSHVRQWGRIRPGTHFDLPLKLRNLPRYAVFANHGKEGLEWFSADDLSQWNYQLTGESGTGLFKVAPTFDPIGISLSIQPLNLGTRYDLPKGGYAKLSGTYEFDYYLGVPIITGKANKPLMDFGFRVNEGKWLSKERINELSEKGIGHMTLHNDGPTKSGLFWADGSYPPYPPKEMKKMDRTIENIHRAGLTTIPYFSNHELHPSTPEFKQFGKEWGRMVDDQGNLRPNFHFGVHMCLKSGWKEFFKHSVDTVLTNHDFDGVYYDWNVPLFCGNSLHVDSKDKIKVDSKGLAAISDNRYTHWDVDELIELMEWTRAKVGADGIINIHNTLMPMFATENFANNVVGMEFTYGVLTKSMPHPSQLPLEWSFGGARPRGVITYGTLHPEASKTLKESFAITALMTGVFPWRATDESLKAFKILELIEDIETYTFQDYRNSTVDILSKQGISAVYSKEDKAYILLANPSGNSAILDYNINLENLPFPIPKATNLRVLDLDRIDQRVFKTLQPNGKLELKSNEIMIVKMTVEK